MCNSLGNETTTSDPMGQGRGCRSQDLGLWIIDAIGDRPLYENDEKSAKEKCGTRHACVIPGNTL